MSETNDPKPDDPKPDDSKPDDPQGPERADAGLARAHERIKSANEELARLDQLVSGMERGSDSPPIRQEKAATEPSDAVVDKTPPPESKVRPRGLIGDRPMLRAFVGLFLAIGILGAAFASQYRHEARAIMARWAAPPVATAPPEASGLRAPAKSPAVQLAAADEQPSPPAPASRKDADDVPSTGATTAPSSTPANPASAGSTPTGSTSAGSTSTDLAQSLKTIAQGLASINDKLEQLKSSHEQTLRDHAEAIQQLKAAQEQSAGDNARIAEQVQALQTQLAVLPAKPAAPSLMKQVEAAPRHYVPAAAPRRPKPPRRPWMPPRYMAEPWDYPPDW
ncbi:hypothetical protein [Bradyrhizobium iriomotense]|uniref:Uncharacterized protein n=1 Tax=Bradyrhizobium iriomotense TaxID=441950 RepID=A0ABQ6BE33_9BRAD|nr:hypothetical protein [Bradyrhizobium iriomotense]GLR90422.1 hypothetical protein GCM10007857_71370 [Bradyrhizobium iriomotense]